MAKRHHRVPGTYGPWRTSHAKPRQRKTGLVMMREAATQLMPAVPQPRLTGLLNRIRRSAP